MTEDEEYEADEEGAEHIAEVKKLLAADLEARGVNAYPWELDGDVYVEGALSVIVDWAYDWRSEIEELG